MAGIAMETGTFVTIGVSQMESPAVRIAAQNLKQDLMSVLAAEVSLEENKGNETIIVGTIGVSQGIEQYFDPGKLQDELGNFRKEAYIHAVSDGKLVIAGTDRRGTIYGIYDFCEWIGVSPWYYWADVPIRKKERIQIPEDYEKIDFPSVEYRGIFINDEEELDHWARLHMNEDTIGVHTYEKIFELLLRLKGNYIWPAMHVNSFNRKQENGALAERMGIVVGTSHCDMLMRSNNREWRPWLEQKGYQDVRYDYSVTGKNREILHEYWRESVRQNKEFEVSYTLGMRGIHDSGFETSMLTGNTEEELRQQKIRLLETVIENQNKILEEELDEVPLKLFIPYKEVLELYDEGLCVPEEFTIIWSNDNYGYIRRYPSEKERKRQGGHGIYYHNSYWSPPGRSYLFLCSTPLAHTKYELMKAYHEGIQKLWILNVGALKPLEMETEFFLRLAWEAGKEEGRTRNVDDYVSQWLGRNFTGAEEKMLGPLLNQFSQIANVRKLEMMEDDVFSQTAYGDEGAVRLHKLREIVRKADGIYRGLPEEEKDAFFQMVLLRIHAVWLTMCQYYFSDRSTLCHSQGKMQAAALYVKETREYEDARRKLIFYYNQVVSGGKWNGIVTPEDFPPPRTAMYPACTPPLQIGERKMLVHLWNEEERLSFRKPGIKWLEISNGGEGWFDFHAEAPEWVELSESRGRIYSEKRIMVTVKEIREGAEGEIRLWNETDKVLQCVPIEILPFGRSGGTEEDGAVVIPMQGVEAEGFRTIHRLGREEGDLLEGYTKGAEVSFPVFFESDGKFLLEIHRFPSLNSTGRIRVGIQMDHGEVQIVESQAKDEWKSTWSRNTMDNVDRLYLTLPWMERGHHCLSVKVIDRYFAFSRMVIYTKQRKENNLGIIQGNQELPQTGMVREWAERFYGISDLGPRKEIFADAKTRKDSLTPTDQFVESERYAETKKPEEILKAADSVFCENENTVKIDAVTAYMQTQYAYTTNGNWQYCSSESYGRSGLAMYLRQRGRTWERAGEAPALNYEIECGDGSYTLWILMRIDHADPSCMAVAVDGMFVEKDLLYHEGKTWRYEAEQVWRWIPFARLSLAGGRHLLTVAVMASGIRIDRLYLSDRNNRPPVDLYWNAAGSQGCAD